MFNNLFKELDLSEVSQRIYSHLIESGSSSARQLSENLNIPRPSVYDNIKILIQNGLVVEQIQNNKKLFQVDDLKNLPRLIKTKIDKLDKEKRTIEKVLPSLAKTLSSIEPKIKFYSGVEGVKQVLNDILWYENIETLAMWPISEMIRVLGYDYFENHNRDRIRQNISIRAIWPQERSTRLKDHPALGVGKGFLREIRLAPKRMVWDMGYWNYADKVAFISSRKETFGFIVSSKDFSQLLKAQFDIIWSMSKRIKEEPEHTDAFLKTVWPRK
jgi:sugar-specific transcriptional regulator TrmB